MLEMGKLFSSCTSISNLSTELQQPQKETGKAQWNMPIIPVTGKADMRGPSGFAS